MLNSACSEPNKKKGKDKYFYKNEKTYKIVKAITIKIQTLPQKILVLNQINKTQKGTNEYLCPKREKKHTRK